MALKLLNSQLLHNLRLLSLETLFLKRFTSTTNSTRSAEAVFVENSLEEPIITITDHENVDLIGPPDPLSNLRPIVRKRLAIETELQQTLRRMQDATHEWNQQFWAVHNTKFLQERKKFVKSKHEQLGTNDSLSAEEMSEFYKKFLNENWHSHVEYNMTWYKKNFHILLLSLRSSLPQSLHFMGVNEKH